jgi:hypothetical protein
MALTVDEVQAALESSSGNISFAARKLGCSRRAIYDKIQKSPTLKAALEDARETALDNAESALQSAVLAKEAWAVCFTLKTIGKGRGYVERNEVTGANGKDFIPPIIYIPSNGRDGDSSGTSNKAE